MALSINQMFATVTTEASEALSSAIVCDSMPNLISMRFIF